MPAVYAVPEGEGPFPGVVIIHDLTGFREDTIRHCKRFAEAGYAAIAPNTFTGGVRCLVEAFGTTRGWSDGSLRSVETARAWLAEQPEVDADRIAVTGFCMGGGFALLAAANGKYAVAAPFYGVVPRTTRRLRGLCPTIAQFGGKDLFLYGHPERLGRHLRELDVPHEIHTYPEAGHSFMNDHPDMMFALGRFTPMRAAHHPEVEARAWDAMMAFFDKHLA
jgi:carboxymethylenebutenolidase